MPILLFFVVCISIASILINIFFARKNSEGLRKLIDRNASLLCDLQIKTTDLQSNFSYAFETLERELKAKLSHIESILPKKEPAIQNVVIKRRSRTQEQKDMASKIMKARWEKRRQEQKASIPDAEHSIPKLLGSG